MAKRKQISNHPKPAPQVDSAKVDSAKVDSAKAESAKAAAHSTQAGANPEANPGANPAANPRQADKSSENRKSTEKEKASNTIPGWLWGGVLLLLVVAAGGWWLVKPMSVQPTSTTESTVETTATSATVTASTTAKTSVPHSMGNVTGCRTNPKFVKELGFTTRAFLSTSERAIKGLVLVEPSADNNAANSTNGTERRTYQHPSWSSVGYLGPTLIDKDGYVYVASAPRVNLIDNPPEIQDTLYRVDTNSQELKEYMRLPSPRPPSQSNPYGILGLAYDCETQSLYVSSIAGSSRQEEVGRIYRLDVANQRIAAQLEGVDAIGISIFNGSKDKRLYYSSARTQEIRSIALDSMGNFVDQPRVDFSLVGLGLNGNEKARRISFLPGSDSSYYMQLDGMQFAYNLAPPPSTVTPTIFRFRYDPAGDRWALFEVTQ